MIRKPVTKQSLKTVLESQPLQALVTELPEDKEGAIVGGVINRPQMVHRGDEYKQTTLRGYAGRIWVDLDDS